MDTNKFYPSGRYSIEGLHNGRGWKNRSPEYKRESLAHAKREATKSCTSEQTNSEFAKQEHFIEACKNAGVSPSKQQASRFRRKFGAAYRSLV